MKNELDAKLRQLQLIQLEILNVIDRFCRENDIHYSLYAGTLLGAVRHQGFIPWDDDLDICMSREEYDRFIRIWEEKHPDGYILQNKENAPSFSSSFSKIRKDHTCFLQFESEIRRYHTGIFVDVFPIDRMPEGRLNSKIFQYRCLKYQLLTREYVPTEGSSLQKAFSKIILGLSSKKKRPDQRKRLLARITRYNSDASLPAVAIEIMKTIRTPLPADFMTEFTDIDFEGKRFMSSALWDEYLTAKFGDYMKLPPESERVWRHHPIILDFEHNYDELPEEEKLPD